MLERNGVVWQKVARFMKDLAHVVEPPIHVHVCRRERNLMSGHTKKTTDWLGRAVEEHFDDSGHKVGETRFTKDWLGRTVQEHFDASDTKTGETKRGSDWLGRDRAEHFDSSGRHVGYSRDDTDWLGRPIQRHYDESGAEVGASRYGRDWLGRPQKEHEGEYYKGGAPNQGENSAGGSSYDWRSGSYQLSLKSPGDLAGTHGKPHAWDARGGPAEPAGASAELLWIVVANTAFLAAAAVGSMTPSNSVAHWVGVLVGLAGFGGIIWGFTVRFFWSVILFFLMAIIGSTLFPVPFSMGR